MDTDQLKSGNEIDCIAIGGNESSSRGDKLIFYSFPRKYLSVVKIEIIMLSTANYLLI